MKLIVLFLAVHLALTVDITVDLKGSGATCYKTTPYPVLKDGGDNIVITLAEENQCHGANSASAMILIEKSSEDWYITASKYDQDKVLSQVSWSQTSRVTYPGVMMSTHKVQRELSVGFLRSKKGVKISGDSDNRVLVQISLGGNLESRTIEKNTI